MKTKVSMSANSISVVRKLIRNVFESFIPNWKQIMHSPCFLKDFWIKSITYHKTRKQHIVILKQNTQGEGTIPETAKQDNVRDILNIIFIHKLKN